MTDLTMSTNPSAAGPVTQTDTTSAVEIRNLTHRYGERTALDAVNLTVHPGEIFGLLGPNGGGKTTLFRILSTQIEPAAGEAHVFGLAVHAQADAVRQVIGVVFQSPSLDRHLTVRENLLHQGHLYGLSGKGLRDRMAEALESVRLSDRTSDAVGRLSGGMQRRVEIAKALLHRPRLLLLDEPGTGLDPSARLNLREELAELRRSHGVTSLLTTHLMEEAEHCDRVAILHEGRVVAVGSPEALCREVGAEVVVFETDEPEQLVEGLRARGHDGAQQLEKSVRLEVPADNDVDAARLLIEVVEAFTGMVKSARIGRPTLEDVFVHHTGAKL